MPRTRPWFGAYRPTDGAHHRIHGMPQEICYVPPDLVAHATADDVVYVGDMARRSEYNGSRVHTFVRIGRDPSLQPVLGTLVELSNYPEVVVSSSPVLGTPRYHLVRGNSTDIESIVDDATRVAWDYGPGALPLIQQVYPGAQEV